MKHNGATLPPDEPTAGLHPRAAPPFSTQLPTSSPAERSATPATPKLSRPGTSLARHGRKCTVCRHPDRASIEQQYLDWHSPRAIAQAYRITERSIYRHARALALHAPRNRKLRFSLGNMLEHAGRVRITAGSVIQAVCAFTNFVDDAHWIKAPKEVTAHAAVQKETRRHVRDSVLNHARQPVQDAAASAPSASGPSGSAASPDFLIVSARRATHAATA